MKFAHSITLITKNNSRYEHENPKTGLSSSPDDPDSSPDRCELVLEHDIEHVGDS